MMDVPGVMIASTSSAGSAVPRESAVSIATRALRRPVSRVLTYAAFSAGFVRSVAWLWTAVTWPYLSPSAAFAVLYAMTSASVFIGVLAGSRAKYAARSRLNSWNRMELLLAAFGAVT